MLGNTKSTAVADAKGLQVLSVEPGSIAEYVGIAPGDLLISLNSHPISDILDYWYQCHTTRLTIQWESKTRGKVCRKTVRKSIHDRLGIELEPFEIRRCNNACVFCFVHQLPRGLRPDLYIKDEDYRLSFLYGNYITGTSLSDADIERILKLRLSPLYFSVHATDESVRRNLLVNPHAPPIIPLLRKLVEGGIEIHTQVVLCPEINDGKILEQTVADLSKLYPGVRSVAVVPVGLTSHRRNLPKLLPVTKPYAVDFLRFCEKLQKRCMGLVNFPFVFPSDEFYLLAEQSPPDYSDLEEIPQLENGVGMVSNFYRGLTPLLASLPRRLKKPLKVLAITSPLGLKVIEQLVSLLNARIENLTLHCIAKENSLFGKGITVTGLLPGCDFAAAIDEFPDCDRFLVPKNALRPWDNRFLDDLTLEDLQTRTHGEIRVGGATAESFVEAMIGDLLI